MQCSKQPVNLGTFGQVLGSLTDYNFASADEDDLGVLRSIAPGHHGYIVEIDPNGLCFEISALHPRCHSRKLSLPGRKPSGCIPLGAKSRHCAAQHSPNVLIAIRARLSREQERFLFPDCLGWREAALSANVLLIGLSPIAFVFVIAVA